MFRLEITKTQKQNMLYIGGEKPKPEPLDAKNVAAMRRYIEYRKQHNDSLRDDSAHTPAVAATPNDEVPADRGETHIVPALEGYLLHFETQADEAEKVKTP